MRRAVDADQSQRPLTPRPAEQILIDALGEVPPGRILCTSRGAGAIRVAAAARADATSHVCCSFLDLYALEQARLQHADAPPNLRLECAADFPDGPFDAVVLPVSTSGEAELVRDWLQSGHERLRDGGTMLAATDNPSDVWLHGELRKLFSKVTRRPVERGTLFKAIKTEPLKKLKELRVPVGVPRRGPADPSDQPTGRLQPSAGRRRRRALLRAADDRGRVSRSWNSAAGRASSRWRRHSAPGRARAGRRFQSAGRRVHQAGCSNSTGFQISTCG